MFSDSAVTLNILVRAIIVRKKFWGLHMLTWVWLARVKHEVTKPKSTFRPQNFRHLDTLNYIIWPLFQFL